MQTIAVKNITDIPSRLNRLASWLHQHRNLIVCIQWTIVAAYLFLVIVPAFLPLPQDSARITNNLVRFAQFLFWGIWWPFVILSMFLVGRTWCGIFCPEGTLTEWVSHRSLNIKPIPKWIKWPGWPFLAFVMTTVYGQMISVYDYAKPTLLILGGSTAAAIALAFFYGRDRRVWCKYLCPVNGVFHLLARLSPIHIKVDREMWSHSKSADHTPVICAPLINIKHMESMSECHQCFRCHQYKNAVFLETRSPNTEILSHNSSLTQWHLYLLVFGIFGLSTSAFTWTSSPLMVELKKLIVQWIATHEWWWLLNDVSYWWLFTHFPQNNDVFNWVDAIALFIYFSIGTLTLGASLWVGFRMAQKTVQSLTLNDLLETLTPLAGCVLFLGLSLTTLKLLHLEGIDIAHIDVIQGILLTLALCWSWYLLHQKLAHLPIIKQFVAAFFIGLGLTPTLFLWGELLIK